jgi:uncharacterized Zn-binding protein involved in type VI secretion
MGRAVTFIGARDNIHCGLPFRAVGSANVKVGGIGVSRQGDNNTGHLLPGAPCPSHAAPIAIGSLKVKVNGKGCGRIGDSIAGCTSVAEGHPKVFAG